MKQLALKARVLRDGQWQEIDAKQLVPGDIVRLRLGDVIPADIKLVDGDYLSVDQSTLTGESLPVTKRTGDTAFSGTVIKQGEVLAEVTSTGANTRLGKTASLVQQAKTVSHFQKAVLTIGDYLISDLPQPGVSDDVANRRPAPWHRLAGAGAVRFDPHRCLHSRRYASGTVHDHGHGCHVTLETQGHRHPFRVHRRDGQHGYSVLG